MSVSSAFLKYRCSKCSIWVGQGGSCQEMQLQSRIPISHETVDDNAVLPRPQRYADQKPRMTLTGEMGSCGRLRGHSGPATYFKTLAHQNLQEVASPHRCFTGTVCVRGPWPGHKVFSTRFVGSSLQHGQGRNTIGCCGVVFDWSNSAKPAQHDVDFCKSASRDAPLFNLQFYKGTSVLDARAIEDKLVAS